MMISVGNSRDGRNGLRLGFGGVEAGKMMELEEGETNFDADVDLAYIDEKIQDILCHFQKDFDGVLSAKRLGPKFGGYGSFLPAYQRAPILFHPRTPQKVQNYNPPRSLNNLTSSEAIGQNAKGPSSTTFSKMLGPTSTSAVPRPVDISFKIDSCLPSALPTGDITSKHEPVNKLVNPNDQKTLKVGRLKVGPEPDSLVAKKNAAIYSCLGLDLSPSSSVDDNRLTQSRGLSPKSPMNILQTMTSFPINGGCLLSPLSDTLVFDGKKTSE